MSGLLETFYFLFTSDAKALNKGLQDSEKDNKKLSEGLSATDKVADKLGKNLVGVVRQGAAAIASIMAFSAVKAMIVDQANFSDQMAKTALQTRMSVENLSAYSRAVVDAGGDANAFAATLERLGEHGRNPIQMLDQLRSRFQGLSQAQAIRLGKIMGLDIGTIELLTKTKTELAAIIAHQKELGYVTAEDAAAARAFNNQLRDSGAVYDDIKRKLSTAIMPALTGFFHILERILIWLRDNKTFTLSFFGAVAGIITAVYLPAIISAAAWTYALIAPFLLIIAAVAGVALVFALLADDMYAFMKGNDSLIGDLAKKWPWLGGLIRQFGEVIIWLKDIVGDAFSFIADCWEVGPVKAFNNLVENVVKGSDKIKNAFPLLYAVIQLMPDIFRATGEASALVWNTVTTAFSVYIDTLIAAFNKLKSIYETIKQFLKGAFKASDANIVIAAAPGAPVKPNIATPLGAQLAASGAAATAAAGIAGASMQATESHPLAAVTSNAISNRTTNQRSMTIKVDAPVTVEAGGQDPEKVNDAIVAHLENAIKGAINHHDDGLVA